jgi:2-keto-3-deoxy-L-rhamnonate aldolase RhmA
MDMTFSLSRVDAIFVGPFDLSMNLGFPGEFNHPREIEAIERVVDVCQWRKLTSGIRLFDLPTIQRWIEKGMGLTSSSSDVSFLADPAAAGIAELRQSTGK